MGKVSYGQAAIVLTGPLRRRVVGSVMKVVHGLHINPIARDEKINIQVSIFHRIQSVDGNPFISAEIVAGSIQQTIKTIVNDRAIIKGCKVVCLDIQTQWQSVAIK